MRGALLRVSLAAAAGSAPLVAQPPTPPAAPPAATRQSVAAQETQGVVQGGGKLTAYYAIPEIPATTMLGITPASITRPATHKDFVSSVLDGIDAAGRVKQGIALEASLGLLRAFRVPLETYQSSRRARIFSNVLLSLATTRAAGDTSSTDLAWGVRVPLVDEGDPLARRSYTTALGLAMLRCAPSAPPGGIKPNVGQTQAQLDEEARADSATFQAQQLACLGEVASGLGKAAAESLWNSTRLVVAYAGSTRLRESALTDRARLGDRYWATGSIPLARITGPMPIARSSQVIGYADVTRQRAIDTLPATTTIGYGGRINIGSATFNGFYELLGESRRDPPAGVPSRNSTWSAGIEFLATEGLWISTGIGKRAEDALKPDRTVVLANLRWGISSKSFLDPTPGAP